MEDEFRDGGSNGIKSIITSKKSTEADYLNFKGTVGTRSFGYLTLDAKKAFNYLWHVFTKALILQHFDLECHIRVETNASGHAISRILSQLTLHNLGQWHLMAYYLHKIIPVKTWYKTHDSELLTIVKAFKTWWYYLKGCKYKVLVFTNHNNLCHFIDIKSLSSRQVRLA